jgi:hypothetical protein
MRRLPINLATTPFMNKILPLAALAAVWGIAAILTALNLGSFFLLGREYRKERALLGRQEQRIESVQKDVVSKQKILDSSGVATFSREVEFTGGLLRSKRFSWTKFLEDLEGVKAYGVRFTAIAPQVKPDGSIGLNLRGVANPRSELSKLENNLLKDPRFSEVQLTQEQKDPSGPLVTFTITCLFNPEAGRAA